MARMGRFGRPLVIAAALALPGCQQGSGPLTSAALPTAPTRLALVADDYDDDPAASTPVDPASPLPPVDTLPPATPADPGLVPPAPVGVPGDLPPDPGAVPPVPTTVVVSIVGFSGPTAFNPNPMTAPAGTEVIWTNHDMTYHHIVLADGTDVGDLAPGQSSVPIALSAPRVEYACTIHPSMVGVVYDPALAEPPAAEPPAPPAYDYLDPYYDDDYNNPYYRY